MNSVPKIFFLIQSSLVAIFILFVTSYTLLAQEEKEKNKVYSLDVINDLLDTEQNTSAKPLQTNTFGQAVAPENSLFSIDILTEQEIRGFGAVSIPEALRHVPGVLVKQLSSGVYEVFLQSDMRLYGTGNPIPTNNLPILVMIDFEPIDMAYNHQIAWETLPIGMNEIAQIEVFKASQPVWYGSQAVSGVIHIIRNTDEWKKASIRVGNQRNFHADVKIPIGSSDKFQATIGGHFNYTDKPENEFYIWGLERYVPADSALLFQPNAEQTNLFSSQSFRGVGGNLKLVYQPKKGFTYSFNGNGNFSEANLPWLYIDQIAEARRTSNRYSGSFRAQMNNFSAQLLYRSEQLNLAEGYGGFLYTTQVLSSDLSYRLALSEKIILQPQLSFREDTYKNKTDPEADNSYGTAFDGTLKRQILAGSINLQAKASETLQLFAGIRAESVSLTDDLLLGMHLASAIKLGENSILHISLARSSVQPTFEAWSINRSYIGQNGDLRDFVSNKNLEVPIVSKLDVSFQFPIAKIISSKVEAFYTRLENPILQTLATIPSGQILTMENASGQATALGASFSAEATIGNILFNANVTWQQQNLNGDLTDKAQNAYSPDLYGGLGIVSSFVSDRLLLSGNVYFGLANTLPIPLWNQETSISPLLSARVSYKAWQESSIFAEIKEFGNREIYQSPFASNIRARYMLGGTLQF